MKTRVTAINVRFIYAWWIHFKGRLIIASILIVSVSANTYAEMASGKKRELAATVHTLLAKNCVECHNDSNSKGGLNLTKLSSFRDDGYIVNTNKPSESEIYKRILPGGGMPQGRSPFSQEEVTTILEWIQAGAPDFESLNFEGTPAGASVELNGGSHESPSERSASNTRPLLEARKSENSAEISSTELKIMDLLLNDLKFRKKEDREHIRYLTLTHLLEAGVTESELEAYRQALNKLLNSLSWEPLKKGKANQLIPIDSAGTILRVNLKDFGWSPSKWEYLAQQNPYQIEFTEYVAELLKACTPGTKSVFLRGDWFAKVATTPDNYHQLADIPQTVAELESKLGVNVVENYSVGNVMRVGIPKGDSGVSINNRILERHVGKYGAYWKSFDFKGNDGKGDIFENPLPKGAGKRTFEHAGHEIIFTLPNGLQGYMLADAEGKRISKAPIELVQDKSHPHSDTQIFNGLSCISCHQQGLKSATDKVREHVEANADFFKEDYSTLIREYLNKDQVQTQMNKDKGNFLDALKGIHVEEVGETERIRHLVDQFEQNVTLEHAAAEVGLPVFEVRKAAENSPKLKALLHRLGKEGVPRDSFTSLFPELVATLGLGRVSVVDTESAQSLSGPSLKQVQVVRRPEGRTTVFQVKSPGPQTSKVSSEAYRAYREKLDADVRAIREKTKQDFINATGKVSSEQRIREFEQRSEKFK